MHLVTDFVPSVLRCHGFMLNSLGEVQDWKEVGGDRTAKTRPQEVEMTESKFADDVAMHATTREMLEQVTGEFVRTVRTKGLTVSLEKTKLLTVVRQLKPEKNQPVKLEKAEISTRQDFTYIGSNITRYSEVHGEVIARLRKVSEAFDCLRSGFLKSELLSTKIKRKLYPYSSSVHPSSWV